MEASSRGASTRPGTLHELGSDEAGCGNRCHQCEDDDLTVDAEGYCEDCSDYLCVNCIQQHRRLRASRDHIVLTGSDMPNQKQRKAGGENCSKHPGKPIELYCSSDETFGCALCFALDHKSCTNVELISELSKYIEQDVKTAEQQHETTAYFYRNLIEEYHVINNTCCDKSLEHFESFRAEIEALLDRIGDAVRAEVGNFNGINKHKLDSVAERITSLDTELETHLSAIIELKREMKEPDQLFIAVKRKLKEIQDTFKKLQELHTKIQVNRYVFAENTSIKQCAENMVNTCIKKVASENIKYTGEMKIESSNDKHKCEINGIVVVSPTEMVISDARNKCLKLFDIDQNTIMTRRSLKSSPYDVTLIPESRLGVTVPELHKIHLFSMNTSLKPCGHIAVDGRCISVKSTGDTLVVGYSQPPKVQIMDLNGQVLKSFTTDSSGNPLFAVPRDLSLSPDRTSIFISDWQNNTVTRMSTEGTIEWVYRDKELQYPRGVATGPDGCLYICSRDKHSLHVVSATGMKHAIVPVSQVNLMYPCAICYSKDQNVLFVSSVSTKPAHCDFIRRFALQ